MLFRPLHPVSVAIDALITTLKYTNHNVWLHMQMFIVTKELNYIVLH